MRSFRIAINPRAASLFMAAMLVFAALIPTLASAATVTGRSVELGTSVKNTDDVTYRVKFTTGALTSSTGAFVVDFCTTATIGAACTPASGLDTSGVDSDDAADDATVTPINTNTGVKVVLDTPAAAGAPVDVILTGIDNPTNAGVFYARIVTYVDGTAPAGGSYYYTAPDDIDDGGTHLDDGSVALTMTDGFTVGGRALETLTFCAAKSTDTILTGCTGTLNSPSLVLGTNGIIGTALETGVVKTQVSSNASGGVVVNLKSSTAGCGGLLRDGTGTAASRCGIAPVHTAAAAIGTGAAKFGLKLGNLGGASSTTTVASGLYNTTTYFMNYDTDNDDSTGVTGPYGDPIYHSTGPISDGTADLTFGANISNITPAGNYSATINLIATGTF